MGDTVVLVHGFFRGARDMRPLGNYLERRGYEVIAPGLPTTSRSLSECSARLAAAVDRLLPTANSATDGGDADNAKVHLVGHSAGGLIIRHYLGQHVVDRLGRCVLIATPNSGTMLADWCCEVVGSIGLPWPKGIDCLRTNCEPIAAPRNHLPVELGIIAGNRNHLLLGLLLPDDESDGRVPVAATRCPGMTDFVVLPFGHKEIHHRSETACLVDQFLRTGHFASEERANYHRSGDEPRGAGVRGM